MDGAGIHQGNSCERPAKNEISKTGPLRQLRQSYAFLSALWLTFDKEMKLITVTMLTLCLATSSGSAKELKRVEEKQAKAYFSQYLKSLGKNPEASAFKLKPYGNSTWLIYFHTEDLKPSLAWRHFMNSRGEVRELTMDSMNIVFLNEYSQSLEDEKDREKLIESFTTLHSEECVSIISKVADIPSYTKAPLDTDIADAIRGPFSFGKLTTVVYTYQRIGGIVRRYRFTFDDGLVFRKAECAVVGRDIGEAQYYE